MGILQPKIQVFAINFSIASMACTIWLHVRPDLCSMQKLAFVHGQMKHIRKDVHLRVIKIYFPAKNFCMPNGRHSLELHPLILFCLGLCAPELFQFTCPKVDEGTAATHPRYVDPEDCQYFYVCINGDKPRRNGCKLGQAFDDKSKRCDWARKIPEW